MLAVRQLDFRGLVDAAPEVIAVFDREQRYVYVNAALERATGLSAAAVLGQRGDLGMTPDEAPAWREALEDVLRTGRERAIEHTIAAPQGPRRFASLLTRVPEELVCVVSRDVTEVGSTRVLDIAVQTMATGMLIVEAPSGRILFQNDETERVFGKPAHAVRSLADYDTVVAFDDRGQRMTSEAWPITRALRGETTVGARVEIQRHDRARGSININASPVRGRDGQIIAAVSTYHDVTEVKRAHQAARFLAEAGALLERFEPGTSLQAIVDLAVPVLADWCFIHLTTLGNPAIVALAHADPVTAAEARALTAVPPPLSPSTAVARVLAGGSPELVDVDPAVLEQAARDPAHLDHLRRRGFRSAVVAPLTGRDGVLGAVTFAIAESERRYDAADLDMLAELARRTGIALDNARLFAAEQEARRHAEEARDRTRRLQQLTAMLSSAIEHHQVVSIMVDAGRDALGARAGFAWLLRDGEILELDAYEHDDEIGRLDGFQIIPLTARLPVCDVVRDARPMMFESRAAMASRYPLAVPPGDSPFRAWAVIPFVVAGHGVGAVSFSFDRERVFSDEDRELLGAMIGQASLALERCMLLAAERRARTDSEAARLRERQLYEALQVSEEQLRVALTAGRAAPWRLDLATMTTTRDPAYRTLLGVGDEHASADFMAVHPDDRPILQAEFERTLHDGAPFEPEVRVRRDDGTYMWVRSHGRVMYGPDGRPRILAGVILDIDEAKQASLRAEEERRINETLHRLGTSFASELDHHRLTQLITDEITRLVGAELGAFFATTGEGATLVLQTVSSGQVERYRGLPSPRATPLLGHALAAHQVVRLDDVLADPRYGAAGAPPAGHPVVRSCLAVPVVARGGEVFGSLLFGHPEVGRFTEGHERLAASIASQAAVALENARLYKTVREQKEQLEGAVERARLADRRKDEFLAMLGHELRNPLAPIATALELMGLKSNGVLQKERDVIRRQVDHLARLIDDLLDVSRITRGKISLDRQVLQLAAVLGKAIEMASPLLEKRTQRLVIEVPGEGLPVDADPTRLAQVFQNLLTNAAKYSEPGSQIELRARGQGDRIVAQVIDHGIGIPAALVARLFDLFVQGDRALDRAEGGLGLGLAIAKSLCELHGGTIEAASAGIGQGSTFTVTLPRASRTEGPAPGVAIARASRRVTGTRVLVVDDNVDAAQTLHEFLSTLGHEAAIAHDGMAALDLARSFQPDIAVLDIGLPRMDGYELARQLRALPGGDELRLIAVTGYGQEADRVRVHEAGFDHHLVKPIALDALLPLLEIKASS
jgi:PAS domain S-box-containing protein